MGSLLNMYIIIYTQMTKQHRNLKIVHGIVSFTVAVLGVYFCVWTYKRVEILSNTVNELSRRDYLAWSDRHESGGTYISPNGSAITVTID
jgi:hypothetical protein